MELCALGSLSEESRCGWRVRKETGRRSGWAGSGLAVGDGVGAVGGELVWLERGVRRGVVVGVGIVGNSWV